MQRDQRYGKIMREPFQSVERGGNDDALRALLQELAGMHPLAAEPPVRVDNLTSAEVLTLNPWQVRQYIADHPGDMIQISGMMLVPESPELEPADVDELITIFGPPPVPPEIAPEPEPMPPDQPPEPPPIPIEEADRAREQELLDRIEEAEQRAIEAERAAILAREEAAAQRARMEEREAMRQRLEEAQERIRQLEAAAKIQEAESRVAIAEERLKAAEQRAVTAETKAEAIQEARGIAAAARRTFDAIIGIFRRRK